MTVVSVNKVDGAEFAPLPGAQGYKAVLSETGLTDIEVLMWVKEPNRGTTYKGTMMLFSGTNGTDLYTLDPEGTIVGLQAAAAGWRVVDFEYGSSGWITNEAPFNILARRSAQLTSWVYQNIHGGQAARKRFIALGNSGGASQIGYALARYGIGDCITHAILCSGPAFSILQHACEPVLNEWTTRAAELLTLVSMEGVVTLFHPNPGTICSVLTGDRLNRREQGILSSDAVLNYPNTKCTFIIGRADTGASVLHALEYYTQVTSSKALVEVVGGQHFIPDTESGRIAIATAREELVGPF